MYKIFTGISEVSQASHVNAQRQTANHSPEESPNGLTMPARIRMHNRN